jgi:MarR family transcriptional regulator, lower aerobic nicotinate degradation pathway regulator
MWDRMKEPLGLLASTGYLLARIGSESRRRFVQALEEHDLALAQYGVLMILGELETAPQRGLADAAGIDPRNLVPILDELERRGLLRRGSDTDDRRRHAVALSPAGRTLLTELARAGARAEDGLLRPLSASERKQLHSLLERLLV